MLWDLQQRAEKPDVTLPRQIRFVTADDYPPFNFILPDGTLSGFNVDLARALCNELALPCSIQVRRFDLVANSLRDRSSDAVIASLSSRGSFAEGLAFTAPYYRTPGRFVGRVDGSAPEPSPESTKNLAIGVRLGSAHEAFLRAAFPQARVVPYDGDLALRSALRAKDVPLIFGDSITLGLWLNGSEAAGCCMFRGGPYLDERFFGPGIGIALRQDNRNLRRLLDYALKRVAERGVYAELYLKYFPPGVF